MADYLGVSRRDVGAGIAAGGSALLAAVLVNLWNFVQTFGDREFDTASIAEYWRGSGIVFLGMVVAPVVAVLVGTVVWRVMMPDEPDPRYGVIGGVVSAAGSLVVFAASIGLAFALGSAGTLVGAVSELVFVTAVITVFGGVVVFPFVASVGALVGYGSERYIAGSER